MFCTHPSGVTTTVGGGGRQGKEDRCSWFLMIRDWSQLTPSALFSCRHRLRWHSFQSSHRPSLNSVSLQINCQSVAQMNLLQKYSLLKLTALLEKYTPSNKHGFSW